MRARISFVIPLVVSLAACTVVVPPSTGSSPDQVAAAGSSAPSGSSGVRETLNTLVIQVGQQSQVAPTLVMADGSPVTQPLVWRSSDPTIVMVDPNTGNATGVASGNATLTATLQNNPSVSVSVNVSVVANRTVLLIQVSPATPTMVVGNKLPLTASVQMANGQINGNVTWSSSDNTIATVDPTSGQVSALKPGKVTIVASYTPDSRYEGLADLTVVSDASQLSASPSPTPVVFAPGATPLPTTLPTSVPGLVPPASNSTNGTIASQPTPFVVPTAASYSPPNVTISGVKFVDDIGNAVVPTKGLQMTVVPTFVNSGGSTIHGSSLTISMATSSPDATVSREVDTGVFGFLSGAPGATLTTLAVNGFEFPIQISQSATTGEAIPITFTISDTLGNTWTPTASFTLQ